MKNREALVIGINKYDHINSLKNAVNDAKEIDNVLSKLGFDTSLIIDPTRNDLFKEIIRLKKTETQIRLIYYAGHGVQSNGINYLLPRDSNPQSEDEIPIYGIELSQLINETVFKLDEVNIIILDTCRSNPFKRSFSRSLNLGLAPILAPSGSIIAFSTSPGQVASDGNGRNGLYTEFLLKELVNQNLSLIQIFQNVRKNVLNTSDYKQIPWESTSLIGDFYFFTPNNDSDIRVLDIKRKVANINSNTYKYISKDSFVESSEGGELNVFLDGDNVIKIENEVFGEMGKFIETLYFNNTSPIYFKEVSYEYNTHICDERFDMDRAIITTKQYFLELERVFYSKSEQNVQKDIQNEVENYDSTEKYITELIKNSK